MFRSFDYRCECGAYMADYFHDSRDGDPPESFKCVRCDGGLLERVRVYPNRTLGAVWSGLDAINQALLSAKDRANGAELKTQKDIENLERLKKVYRPTELEERVWRDESLHDAAVIRKIQREDGTQAAIDYVDTTEIMAASGMTKQETEQWKARTNAAAKSISARDFEPTPA